MNNALHPDAAMPNIALLTKTLNFIADHPEEWDQGIWCGTPCCFAGRALDLAGVEVDESREEVAVADMPECLRLAARKRMSERDTIGIGYAARLVLGLNADQANDLFNGSNSLRTLRHIVAELCGETVEAGVR